MNNYLVVTRWTHNDDHSCAFTRVHARTAQTLTGALSQEQTHNSERAANGMGDDGFTWEIVSALFVGDITDWDNMSEADRAKAWSQASRLILRARHSSRT